jgi:TonB family protein
MRHRVLCSFLLVAAVSAPLAGLAEQRPVERSPGVVLAVAPLYPPAGLALPQGGDAMIEVTLNQQGDVSDAKPVSGSVVLYRASLEAAKRWKFESSDASQRRARLTFSFRIVPKDAPSEDTSTVFSPPYRVEVRRKLPEPTVSYGPAGSQETGPCAGADKYPDPEPANLVETGLMVLQRVSGVAVIRAGDKIIAASQLHGACLSLFTADSHKFAASAPVDRRGHFEFGTVPPGDYRLVARARGFCTGNDPVRIKISKGTRTGRTIVAYFQPHAIDTCTTAEYAN